MPDRPKRVITVAPMPPEKCAYALARYSRSPDSIRQSLDWVRTHDSQKFLESFYFQYGHASIAEGDDHERAGVGRRRHTATCLGQARASNPRGAITTTTRSSSRASPSKCTRSWPRNTGGNAVRAR